MGIALAKNLAQFKAWQVKGKNSRPGRELNFLIVYEWGSHLLKFRDALYSKN